jgi:hypothetical protein
MTRADWFVVVGAMAFLPYLYITFWGTSLAGDEAHIIVNGKEQLAIPLSKNQELTINGVMGPSRIKVQDGKVRFISSPCNNKQCIHTGWLEHGGEFAACLPNRISLVVTGINTRYDTINF